MKRIIIFCLATILTISCISHRQGTPQHEIKPVHKSEGMLEHGLCLYSCPLGTYSTNFLVDHDIFILSSNRETKFADWVAYQVKLENLHGETHSRNWKRDPDIPPEFTLSPSDYDGANAAYQYDRGHQAPLASFSNHPDWAKTNYLSNITPQKADLNQGAWARLEGKERQLADQGHIAYVLTGTVYTHEMDPLPNANLSHIVPSGYWKIIATENETDKTLHLASFYLDQNIARAENFCNHSIPIEEIESMTGFQFFSQRPSARRQSLLSELGC